MPSSFQNAIAAAMATTKAAAGEAVEYQRDEDSVELTAIPARTQGTAEGDIASIAIEIRDWLIDCADLILTGEEVKPERGDYIVYTAAGIDYTYEVLPVDGNNVARHSDRGATRWRIHTKLIRQEAA